jgi:hypothetical protein
MRLRLVLACRLLHTGAATRWPLRLAERSGPTDGAQMFASSAVISLTADLASPNSIAVFGSK